MVRSKNMLPENKKVLAQRSRKSRVNKAADAACGERGGGCSKRGCAG
jgi:hypothetical protein